MAYDSAAYYLRGDHANLNFPHLLKGVLLGEDNPTVSLLEAKIKATFGDSSMPNSCSSSEINGPPVKRRKESSEERERGWEEEGFLPSLDIDTIWDALSSSNLAEF